MPLHAPKAFVRLVVISLLVTMFTGILPTTQMAQALTNLKVPGEVSTLNPGGGLPEIRDVPDIVTRYGLVAILVDEETWGSQATKSEGLFGFLGNTSIARKIETYAEDIQEDVQWTRTVIVTVGEDDGPVEIQRMLERFYYEGNPEDRDHTRLSGVVVIGDVPLPVVNKGGHRFVSMLPYTDFNDPSYVLDEDTLDFVQNLEGQDLQAEVWHGLMVPPVSGQAGVDMLSSYFEKNHAFHDGDETYSNFDQKLFIGDFVTEEKTLNSVSFDSYNRYLDLWEETVYYQYTNDLVEDIYTDLQESVTPGDGLDNDGDGKYDEEASNAIDDDGDGLVDEDIGDGFHGIDNDGDGLIDEDGFADNNNDAGWVIPTYLADGGGKKLFEDMRVDEDPPGDTTGGEDLNGDGLPDGDGCPGLCGIDDNGDSIDHDNDGYPTGWEILYGYDPFDPKKPHKLVSKKVKQIYGREFETEEAATKFLEKKFIDNTNDFRHVSCYDDAARFHPEWDDDEDGFCDEDGSTENRLWANDFGVPYVGECAFNDADCDGLIDEDNEGMAPAGIFDNLPDMQARNIVKSMTNRYAEIFDQPQGIWNRFVQGTGRYAVRDYDGETVKNDFDSVVSLIAKKDEYVQQYLKSVNDDLELALDEIVVLDLQNTIPAVAALMIAGEFVEDGAKTQICDPTAGEKADKACVQFINHGTDSPNKGFNAYVSGGSAEANNFRMYGYNAWNLAYDGTEMCNFYGGTDEEGGQITEFNRLYRTSAEELVKKEIKNQKNCTPDLLSYRDDIPEICAPIVAESSVRGIDAAKAVEPSEISKIDIGFDACYEFREINHYNDYADNNGKFNDWLTGKIRRFRKKEDEDDVDSYNEFLEQVDEKRDNAFPLAGILGERKQFWQLDLIPQSDAHFYSLTDLFKDMGWEDFNDDDIDLFMALRDDDDSVRVLNPQNGTGMSGVSEVTVFFDKLYLDESKSLFSANLVHDMPHGMHFSSAYKHVQPTVDIINTQIQDAMIPNLPIDKTRRISFLDKADQPRELNYLNMFNTVDMKDFDAKVDELSDRISSVSGGGVVLNDVEDMKSRLNRTQLADALEWQQLNLDAKHEYLLKHYLGAEEPIVAKARNGYEMVAIIADGDATRIDYGYNDRDQTEEDAEWNHRSQDEIDAALAAAAAAEPEYEALSTVSNTIPIPLAEWVQEIQDWMVDLNKSLSSFDTFENGGVACGYEFQAKGGDDDGDGVPDAADPTVSLSASSEDLSVLQAGGADFYRIDVMALEPDGTLNTGDNFTEVEMEIVTGGDEGDEVVYVEGNPRVQMTGGTAHFYLRSALPGNFTVRARATNRDGFPVSNAMSGRVTSKFVKVTSYYSYASDGAVDNIDGEFVEVFDGDEELLARFNPNTGNLFLRSGVAELREATEDLPTRTVISSDAGVEWGSIFMIPQEKFVGIGDGLSGVFVNKIAIGASAELVEGVVYLTVDGDAAGAVNNHGQIFLDEGFRLSFENPGAINLYEPLHILNGYGETMFTVEIKDSFSDVNFQEADEEYEDYLTKAWPKAKRGRLIEVAKRGLFGKASAESVILDSDSDLLNDLEEWTVGTDQNDADTDGDGFEDGAELFTGFDPLLGNEAALFTDIDPSHPAYHDLLVLYLRGVIKGYEDGSFKPDNRMSREEFVKVNFGSICINCDNFDQDYEAELMSEYGAAPFPDRDINPELLACVAQAKVDDVVSGYEAGPDTGKFVPKRFISRAEATKVLVETADLPVAGLAEGEKWYREYANTAELYALFPEGSVASDFWLEAEITRSEFVQMAANLLSARDCREFDTDGDGLSDNEEIYIYGTDINKVDTDDGGVDDLTEVLRDSDPLNGNDDFPGLDGEDGELGDGLDGDGEGVDLDGDGIIDGEEDLEALFDFDSDFAHEPGLYLVSDHAALEEVAVADGEGGAVVNVFTNETPANGESTLTVRAEIRDKSSRIYTDDNSSVIEFVLSSRDHGNVLSRNVQVNKGFAETVFLASELAGEIELEARITDSSLPSEDALIKVYAGEPVRTEITSDSSVLPAGGESVTDMQVKLYDSFNNLANHGFYSVTIDSPDGLEILDLFDENPDLEGIQVTTPDGFVNFRVLASSEPGVSSVTAKLAEIPDSGSRFNLNHLEGMSFEVEIDAPFVLAGSESQQSVTIRAVDRSGLQVNGFNGLVLASVSDVNYGELSETGFNMNRGEANISYTPGTLAGTASIFAESAGIVGGSTSLLVRAADTYELRIRKSDNTNVLSAGRSENFYIEAFDVFGNFADRDQSTSGTIRITEATQEFADITKSSFRLLEGVSSFTVTPHDASGKVNLVATADDVLYGSWGGDIDYSLNGDTISELAPQMLYGSVLGAAFGDVTTPDYIGGYLTFNGKTQAITSLISEPVPKKRLAILDAEGAVNFPEESMVNMNVLSAGADLPLRMQWRNFPGADLMAEIIYVLPNGLDDVSTKLLVNRSDIELEEKDDALILRDRKSTVLKIRDDGQILILDPRYALVFNSNAEGLGFGVMRNTETIMRIDFAANWTGGVNLLDDQFVLESWDSLESGLYIKPTSATVHDFVKVPTGNSSKNAMGMALIDPKMDLPASMQASLGYQSLEAAESNGGIGWEDENKHLLLFAAGNTVGQSNLYYPSEVGVVLGDPTVKLQTRGDVNDMGFTSDIGTMVSASQDDVVALLDIDYNGDGQEDVLMAYDDGRVEVLQNLKAPVRLQSEGTILHVENGIASMDSGDINGDGLEDLVVVTETSCFVDEMCLYVYENIDGGFVAKNLTIEGIEGKPSKVIVEDLNNDGFYDLVLTDENMKLYVVWNAAGELSSVDLIEDFGLEADSRVNLNSDVALSHEDMENGPVMVQVLVDEEIAITLPVLDQDVQDFVDRLSLSDDFDLTVNGLEDAGDVQRRENRPFDYADAERVEKHLETKKIVRDLNGGKIEMGDILSYSVTVQNVSATDNFTDLYISDLMDPSASFDDESLTCLDCRGGDVDKFQNGSLNRPWIFGPVLMRKGESVTIQYQGKARSLPSVQPMVGQDFYSDYTDDKFADIGVTLAGNNTGILQLYYSDGFVNETVERGGGLLGGLFDPSFKRITYRSKTYNPDDYEDEIEEEPFEDPFVDSDGDGIIDIMENVDNELGIPAAPPGQKDYIAEMTGAIDKNGDGYYGADEFYQQDDDVDGDGIIDIGDDWVTDAPLLLGEDVQIEQDGLNFSAELDLFNEEVSELTQVVEKIVSTLTCNGGCLAIPGSVAFLTPGNFHDPITGTTLAYDNGFPAFGLFMAAFVPVPCTGPTCQNPASPFRMYISPTTTLGLGMSFCVGPWPAGQCVSVGVPLLGALGVCDAINGFITDALSKATEFTSDISSGKAFNVNPNQNVHETPNGMSSSIFSGYVPQVSTHVNIQVPGFPSIFTEWWKGQKLEFFKMLDLPDITVIYPDPKSLASEFKFKENKEKNLEDEVVELEEGPFQGLEGFLNTVHALPLVDIKPKDTYIHFPWLTEEERLLVKRDWEDWLQDTTGELLRFKQYFSEEGLAQLADPLVQETYDSIVDVTEDAIQAMEANLAVLEGYKEIPEEILKLRDIQAYYAQIIVCYLDAVLGHFAGYIAENAQRIEAWGQWWVDLQGIIAGWEVLIKASINLMDSCDRCTNQRWSAMQLLFSLFAFIPEFPVIELPKLPDIVLDVSHIQAGVDIIWPDIQFVPETVNIPEIPRIALPTAKLKVDFDFSLNIPTLPEFPIIFELPELPGLPLPDLPSLPPPPAIPELHPSIKASLKVTSDILRVICIIRNGFVPVPETMLKQQIENLTERGSEFVLPLDLAVKVEWPGFRRDFLERIEVTTYLNLTADFSLLYGLFENFSEQSEELTEDIAEPLNKAMQDLADEIQKAFLFFDVDLEADLEAEGEFGPSSYVPETHAGLQEAEDLAASFIDHPMVKDNLAALTQTLGTLQTEIDAWADEMPEEYELVATQTMLNEDDPILHRYDEILAEGRDLDSDLIARIQDTPLSGVASMRENLIGYVENLERGTERLRLMDGEEFMTYLAQESPQNDYMFASQESVTIPELFDSVVLAENNPGEEEKKARLLAAGPYEGDISVGAVSESAGAEAINSGLYIQDPETGVGTKLIDYSQESDANVEILFVDMDGDGDEDIVYSLGGDVYVKENHNKTARVTRIARDPQISSVSEMAPAHGSVRNFKSGRNGYETASFSFSASEDATAYEVVFYDSLDASESAPDENLKRMLLTEEDRNESLPMTDGDGEEVPRGRPIATDRKALNFEGVDMSLTVGKNNEFIMPDIRDSRLVATAVSGNIKIYDARKRTVISSDGELRSGDEVQMQTMEDAKIKITENGKVSTLNLPEYTWVQFGRADERVIRIESGSVIWIENDVIEEQDLIKNMEIFADENVVLLSGGADATLQTSEGVILELDKRESFMMDELISSSNPSSRIGLENGAFYTQTRGLYKDGSIGTFSSEILLNPQVCGDSSSPYPIIGEGGGDGDDEEDGGLGGDGDGPGDGGGGPDGGLRDAINDRSIDLAIYSTHKLSAEQSFDSDSEIVDAYWDLDASVDADGDGIANNDAQLVGLTAEIGPYDDIDRKEVTLWVFDTVGNNSSARVYVDIYVPNIILSDATTLQINGTTSPLSPEFPFHIVRDRDGLVTEVGDGYLTDDDGNILINNLSDSDLLSVFNAEGQVIAEFNPTTKQAIAVDERYDIKALAAEDGWPSRLAVYEKVTGLVHASFVFVSDNNRFINEFLTPLEGVDIAVQKSVTVYFYEEESYEINESGLFGRDALGTTELMITRDGNITIFDPSYEVRRRDAESLDEYLILEIYKDDVLELELWPGSPDGVDIVTSNDFDLPPSLLIGEGDSLAADFSLYFQDVSNDDVLFEDIAEMVERGVLEGYERPDGRYFLPDQQINRAEFAKIVLGILCIAPGEDAYISPHVFNDILSSSAWFYPYTKEAFNRDLITGYLGEIDADGLAPYKPTNTITRAEAAKIVLEALDQEGVIELPDNLTGEPWYEPYIRIAQDLAPYMTEDLTQGSENFILTTDEARDPNHIMTRYEFVEMSSRVLQAHNCFDLDSDNDGLINYDEENIYGSDPYNPDSDEGGVADGVEVTRGTDPTNGEDDFEDQLIFEAEPGVYAVHEECFACPCSALIDYASDFRPGDEVFAIIKNEDEEVFGVSNSLPVKSP
ncbi:hypothetical protein HOD30_05585 [Candidatus Peregrinibacteria bacterium]|nr:hypothetical protein [Candidatus Peregrinibacteria bacterium]MBT4631493.1 hypothetical protein [Candidatus Peregrinibacteria bacterium]